jgi:hypothetical protein
MNIYPATVNNSRALGMDWFMFAKDFIGFFKNYTTISRLCKLERILKVILPILHLELNSCLPDSYAGLL